DLALNPLIKHEVEVHVGEQWADDLPLPCLAPATGRAISSGTVCGLASCLPRPLDGEPAQWGTGTRRCRAARLVVVPVGVGPTSGGVKASVELYLGAGGVTEPREAWT